VFPGFGFNVGTVSGLHFGVFLIVFRVCIWCVVGVWIWEVGTIDLYFSPSLTNHSFFRKLFGAASVVNEKKWEISSEIGSGKWRQRRETKCWREEERRHLRGLIWPEYASVTSSGSTAFLSIATLSLITSPFPLSMIGLATTSNSVCAPFTPSTSLNSRM